MRVRLLAGSIIVSVSAAAFPESQQVRTERRVAGDTQIVRTAGGGANAGLRRLARVMSFGSVNGPDEYIFGSISDLKRAPDGSLWIFDQQVPILRKYDSTGKYLRTVGRRGAGPGEYTRSNGLAIHDNGNVVLWDQGTLRIRSYSSAGENLGDWTIPGFTGGGNFSFSTFDGLKVDTLGRTSVVSTTFVPIAPGSPPGRREQRHTTYRFSPEGRVVDSLPGNQYKTFGVVPRQVEARTSQSSVSVPVPFSALEYWTWSRHGYFVGGRSDIYAIHLQHPGGQVTRIERDLPAVATTQDQRNDAVNDVEMRLRRTVPNWTYAGPAPASTLPYFSSVIVDDDARIWVRVAVPLRLITDAERELAASSAAGGGSAGGGARVGVGGGGGGGSGGGMPGFVSPLRYTSDFVYDVFAPDGRFLGRVPYPGRTAPRVMKGDYLWGVTTDSLGVQSVTKFRVEPGLGR